MKRLAVALLFLGLLAGPLAVQAQPTGTRPRIGFLATAPLTPTSMKPARLCGNSAGSMDKTSRSRSGGPGGGSSEFAISWPSSSASKST